MWGKREFYLIGTFIIGIINSKLIQRGFGVDINANSTLIVHGVVLPLLLLLLCLYLYYIKRRDLFIVSCYFIIYVLGCNTFFFFNLENIKIDVAYIDNIHDFLNSRIDMFPKECTPLIKAVILGDRSAIAKSEIEKYINTGTLHLFALSGLHTGIIYSLIFYIFYPIKLFISKRWVHPVLCISGILLYSFATGASTSVLRASVMISIYEYNRHFLKLNIKRNVLIMSCFIICLCKPQSLFRPGLQLSFAAITGIYYIYPYMKAVIERLRPNLIIKYILNILSVSLSCQISTLPISLYYFSTISPIFLIGNIVTIPLVSIIIYLSFIGIIISPVKILFNCISHILNILFNILDLIINYLGN